MKKYVKCLDNKNGYTDRLTIGKEYEYDEKKSSTVDGPYRQVYIVADDHGDENGGNYYRFSEPYEKIDKTISHAKALEILNLKPGDTVKVLSKDFPKDSGWENSWNASGMDGAVGGTYKVMKVPDAAGVKLDYLCKYSIHYRFPAHVLEKCVVAEPAVSTETNRVIKKGDKVKILSKFSGISGIHWASEMDKTIGKIGTVLLIDKASSGTSYKVKFVKDDDYWYYPACVLLIVDGSTEELNATDPVSKKLKLKKSYLVGDVVRITKNLSDGHSRDTVCEIVSAYAGNRYLLKKISNSGKIPVGTTFTHNASEFTKCDKPPVVSKSVKIVKTGTKFQPGSKVKIVKNTSHGFSIGTICTVEGWSNDADRYLLKGNYQGRVITQTHNEHDVELVSEISPVKEVVKVEKELTHDASLKALDLKAGDTVQITHKPENDSTWKNSWVGSQDDFIGKTYTIAYVNTSGVHLKGTSFGFPANSMKKVTAAVSKKTKPGAKFKVGDSVKVIKNTSGGFHSGTTGTIVKVEASESRQSYLVKGKFAGSILSLSHKETDLEFASEISPVKEDSKDKYILESEYVEKIKLKSIKTGTPIVTATQSNPYDSPGWNAPEVNIWSTPKVLEYIEVTVSVKETIQFIDYSMLVIG